MHKELDNFVEADIKLRQDLDRKDRVDYIKSKNQGEYLQSSIRVKDSQSPFKISPNKKA